MPFLKAWQNTIKFFKYWSVCTIFRYKFDKPSHFMVKLCHYNDFFPKEFSESGLHPQSSQENAVFKTQAN